ncbi:MAG: uridine diphosphate-N-acetylglucosamine-binding protein YvcK, partial [Phycisphaerales bacterium]|nr:uridine diphosphate-N-acetylglucosamine-binding protein YvcK [Phycisphaerales bacterium]
MGTNSPLRVVVIGGGTGLSALLHGLKAYAGRQPRGRPRVDITAVVTVTDDGGSSGRLRREFDVLPPGDIRNCMVALSEDSALLSRLFQYRFSSGHGLKGHSFGNLFLAALTQVMGDFPDAVKASSEVLKIAGRIYPSTTANVALEATMTDGSKVLGETRISRSRKRIGRVRLIPGKAKPLAATLAAIADADVITLGPGSLFTSVVPNLLVEGIASAIRRSTAVRAYFVNLMWQPGETSDFRASDHVRAVMEHSGGNLLDYAVVNIRPFPSAVMKRYARQHARPVENDIDAICALGVKVT